MSPTRRGQDGITGPWASSGQRGPATRCGYALRTRSSITLDRAGQPDNHGQPILPEESGTLFFYFQQTATSHPASPRLPRSTFRSSVITNIPPVLNSQFPDTTDDGWVVVSLETG